MRLLVKTGLCFFLSSAILGGLATGRSLGETRNGGTGEVMIEARGRPELIKLSLQDLVHLVREKNERIMFQDEEWGISRDTVEGAKAIFEPAFVSSYLHEDRSRRNTVREAVSQGFLEVFDEKSHDYDAALEGLVPTGGKVSLGYSGRAFRNTLNEQSGIDREYQTFVGARLTQPLLKNAGVEVTTAGIRVAEADADIAFQGYREEIMRVISEAASAYWDLYLAQEKYKVRQQSIHIAEEILKDNMARVRTGKMARTEVLEAEAGLAVRRSLLSEAEFAIVSAMNIVRNLFSSSAAERHIAVEATDRAQIRAFREKFSESLDKAFELRAEYLSIRRKIEREDIRLVFARNQRWPQLDLKASYGLNGLATSFGDSWDDARDRDFKDWSVGLELRIPIGGDRKSRSDLEAAKKRRKQALLELKAVEVAVANAVDRAIQSLQTAAAQVRYNASAVDSNRQLLKAETARFEAGRSNSRLLLEREEDLNQAREAELESLVKFEKALLGLRLAEGSLLLQYGIEVMEVNL